eukprot:4915167-Heterocapsa_arctica.AAC.1
MGRAGKRLRVNPALVGAPLPLRSEPGGRLRAPGKEQLPEPWSEGPADAIAFAAAVAPLGALVGPTASVGASSSRAGA